MQIGWKTYPCGHRGLSIGDHRCPVCTQERELFGSEVHTLKQLADVYPTALSLVHPAVDGLIKKGMAERVDDQIAATPLGWAVYRHYTRPAVLLKEDARRKKMLPRLVPKHGV